MAEREGFEPPIRLPVCRISSAVHSTTLPPLQTIALTAVFRFAGWGQHRRWSRKWSPTYLFRAFGYHKSKGRVEPRRSIALHCVGDMRIQVHCCGDCRVAQSLLCDFGMHAIGQELGRVAMSKVVKANVRQIL